MRNSEFSDRVVMFDAYETFRVEQDVSAADWPRPVPEGRRKKMVFGFCKTARCQYDIHVTCCLIVFKRHFGDEFVVLSDGGDEGFDKARLVCQKALGYGQDFQVEVDKPLD